MGGGPIRGDKLPKLISLAEFSDLGLITSNNADIISLMGVIAEENTERSFPSKLVDGKWELLWTTEKETLFFAKNGLFGKPVSGITQTIDIGEGSINNLIEFEGERSFSVLGSIVLNKDTKEGRKVDFKFQSATVTIPPLPSITLPPVGAGWFASGRGQCRDPRGELLLPLLRRTARRCRAGG